MDISDKFPVSQSLQEQIFGQYKPQESTTFPIAQGLDLNIPFLEEEYAAEQQKELVEEQELKNNIERIFQKKALPDLAKAPYQLLATTADKTTYLTGNCTYTNPLKAPSKQIHALRNEEYLKVKAEKALLNRLFFGLIEENLSAIVEHKFLEAEVEKAVGTPGFSSEYSIVAFLKFAAPHLGKNPDELIAVWNQKAASVRSGLSEELKAKLSESERPSLTDLSSYTHWLWAKRLVSSSSLKMEPAAFDRFLKTSDLLFKIHQTVEDIGDKLWQTDMPKIKEFGQLFKIRCLHAFVYPRLKPLAEAIAPLLASIPDQIKEQNVSDVALFVSKLDAEFLETTIIALEEILRGLNKADKATEEEHNARDPSKVATLLAPLKLEQKSAIWPPQAITQLQALSPIEVERWLAGVDAGALEVRLNKTSIKESFKEDPNPLQPLLILFSPIKNRYSKISKILYQAIANDLKDLSFPLAALSELAIERYLSETMRVKKTIAQQFAHAFNQLIENEWKSLSGSVDFKVVLRTYLQTIQEGIRSEIKEKTFKQYKYHSFARFLNLPQIHLRFKNNLKKIAALIPENNPDSPALKNNFDHLVLSVIDEASHSEHQGHLYDHRDWQAHCKSKGECGEGLKKTQEFFRLLNMQWDGGVDLTAKGAFLGDLQESHKVPFPAVFSMAYGPDTSESFKQSKRRLHASMFDQELQSLDFSKFDLAFDAYLQTQKLELQLKQKTLSEADWKQELQSSLTNALSLVNLAALLESSQTVHLISMSNQVIDHLSEADIESAPYKDILKDALKKLLMAPTDEGLLDHYSSYLKGTKKALDLFKTTITAKKDRKNESRQELFQSTLGTTDLGKRFEAERAVYQSFEKLIDIIVKSSSANSLMQLVSILALINSQVPLTSWELQFALNQIVARFKHDTQINKAELLQFIISDKANKSQDLAAEVVSQIAVIIGQIKTKKMHLAKRVRCFSHNDQRLATLGGHLLALMKLCLAERATQALVYREAL